MRKVVKVVYGHITEAGMDRLGLPHQGAGLYWFPRSAIYASEEEAMSDLLSKEVEVIKMDIREADDVMSTTRWVKLEAGDIRLSVEEEEE
jgi:hypothetical protein